MAQDPSPYSGSRDILSGFTCFGRITSVDADSRTCRVKTYGRINYTDGLDLPNVKFLHLAWHPEGDEDVYIPRVGSYAVVLFINSEPYVIGYYSLSNVQGGGGRNNQESLLPGDKTTATIGGNRVTLRSGGTIQVESTKGCRTYWIPSEDLINTVCKNFELEPAGGFVHWTLDKDTEDTRLHFFAWDSLTATTGMLVDIGATENGAMLDIAVGPVDENLALASRNMQMQVQKDGTTTVNVGEGKMILNITPDGNISITTQGTTTVTSTGAVNVHSDADVTVDAGGAANVKSGGDTNVTASGNANVKASKISLNGESSGITTANSHQNVIDLITGAPVTPSTTVFGDI